MFLVKFREALPVLTSKRFSLCKIGRLHCCATWAVKEEEDTMRLERADRAMIRWFCRVLFRDRLVLRALMI